MRFNDDGSIPQVSITTSGMNDGLLLGNAAYSAVYCCNLTNGHMGVLRAFSKPGVKASTDSNQKVAFPYIAFDGSDRFVANVTDDTRVGYKHIDLSVTKTVEVIYRYESSGEGTLEICGNGKKVRCSCMTASGGDRGGTSYLWRRQKELQLVYHGSGAVSLLMIVLKV